MLPLSNDSKQQDYYQGEWHPSSWQHNLDTFAIPPFAFCASGRRFYIIGKLFYHQSILKALPFPLFSAIKQFPFMPLGLPIDSPQIPAADCTADAQICPWSQWLVTVKCVSVVPFNWGEKERNPPPKKTSDWSNRTIAAVKCVSVHASLGCSSQASAEE